jgi:hypothetical protein
MASKWMKKFQVMRVKDRIASQTEYETIIDSDDQSSCMLICSQLLQGAVKEKIKDTEELEIWEQRDNMIMVIAKYFVYTK